MKLLAFICSFFTDLQQFLQNLIYQPRICLTLHLLHGLAHKEAQRLFLAALIIRYRLRIGRNHTFYRLPESAFIVYRL